MRVFRISVNWSLSGSKSPQVSNTLLRILALLNKVVVWMVSTCPLISKSYYHHILWWHSNDFYIHAFRFLDRHCQFSKYSWTLIFFWLWPYAGVLVNQFSVIPSQSTWSVLAICCPQVCFRWPAYLSLRWVSISYMQGGLDFFRMNIFGICCHHLPFNILCKWCII